MERLIIDTGILVALERGRSSVATAVPEDADLAVAAITAAELVVGAVLTGGERRERRSALVEAVLAAVS